LGPIGNTLAAFVTRNRSKRLRLDTDELPENFVPRCWARSRQHDKRRSCLLTLCLAREGSRVHSEDEPNKVAQQDSDSPNQAPGVSQAEEKGRSATEEEKESIKLIFDSNKHITTLSAGSTLLLVTFMKDLLPTDAQGNLAVGRLEVFFIVCSLACFGLVICLAAYTMHKCSVWMRDPVTYRDEVIEISLPIGITAQFASGEKKAVRAYETRLVILPIIIYVIGLLVFSGVVIISLF
jgi:hypothetical protein